MTFSTHNRGHWFDLVITRSTCDNIQMLTVSDGLSDHHTVIVDVYFSCFFPDTYAEPEFHTGRLSMEESPSIIILFETAYLKNCRCCFCHIRDLRRIRRYMSFLSPKLLQLLLLAVDLTIAISFIIIWLSLTS